MNEVWSSRCWLWWRTCLGRSLWRSRWVITNTHLGPYRYGPLGPDTDLFRLLQTHVPDGKPASAYDAFLSVRPVASEGHSAIMDALEPVFGFHPKLSMQVESMNLDPWPPHIEADES